MARVGMARVLPGVYAYVGTLPAGCTLCMQGVKMVVFVTGLCGDRCFYCPVSRSRLYRDVFYVDEEPVSTLYDVLEEACLIGAEGASLTGGDPLARLDRTVQVIRLLKDYMGPDFHLHLYTSGRYATRDALRLLDREGLDEIRFHPAEEWERAAIEKAVSLGLDMRVGVEVPVIPGDEERLKKLILWLDSIGVEFINLNELEVSPSNVEKLRIRGIRVSSLKPVAEGSEETALRIVQWAASRGLRITVHYCPASYKDSVQMRLRLVRKALRTMKPYEEATTSGLIRFLEASGEKAARMAEEGYGEALNGVARLTPLLASRLGGVVRLRYPSPRSHSLLPSEEERVAQQSNDAP